MVLGTHAQPLFALTGRFQEYLGFISFLESLRYGLLETQESLKYFGTTKSMIQDHPYRRRDSELQKRSHGGSSSLGTDRQDTDTPHGGQRIAGANAADATPVRPSTSLSLEEVNAELPALRQPANSDPTFQQLRWALLCTRLGDSARTFQHVDVADVSDDQSFCRRLLQAHQMAKGWLGWRMCWSTIGKVSFVRVGSSCICCLKSRC